MVVLLVILVGILSYEILNAVPSASVPAGAATVDLTSAIRPEVVHHVVPPVPHTAANTGTAVPPRPQTGRAAPSHVTRSVPHAVKPVVRPAAVTKAVPSAATRTSDSSTSAEASFGCGSALSYLSTHAAPGFRFECPGYALGHQAMTCIDVAGVCPGSHLIVIDVPCSAAYMNEASNSWVLEGLRQAPIDPYGYCH